MLPSEAADWVLGPGRWGDGESHVRRCHIRCVQAPAIVSKTFHQNGARSLRDPLNLIVDIGVPGERGVVAASGGTPQSLWGLTAKMVRPQEPRWGEESDGLFASTR